MFDVFYLGQKPGLFAHERACDSILHAQQLSRTRYFWIITYLADYTGFDFLWEPPPWQAHQRHAWASQWQKDSSTYLIPKQGYTDTNYHDAQIIRKPDRSNWTIPAYVDQASIDFSWHPDPEDPPYIYLFDTIQHWPHFGGPEYRVPGAIDVKYDYSFVADTQSDPACWYVPDWIDPDSIDYRWIPDPMDPPYIYEFPVEWGWDSVGGPEYRVPGATNKKYMNDFQARTRPDPDRFKHNDRLDMEDPVFRWRPNPTEPPYIYIFGNQWHAPEIRESARYTVPGATEKKYVTELRCTRLPDPAGFEFLYDATFDCSWEPDPGSPPYIYIFGNQYYSAEVMPTVRYAVPNATEEKYMDVPVAQLPVSMTHWHIPAGVDTRDMDFSWVPDPGEPPYIYQFATQHQKTGGPQYRVPGAEEIKYLDMMRAEVTREAVPIIEIDHMDGNAGQIPNTIRKIRYFDNYRDTLIRLARNLEGEHEHVWVCSSICDYTDFDFSWHPETWQSTMLHVFASDDQKFGDTFYMHVPTFADRAERKALLEWTSVNFVPRVRVPRRPMPTIEHAEDSHVESVKAYPTSAPLTVFTNQPIGNHILPAVNLWRAETKTIIPLDAGGVSVIVPKAAATEIRTQLYDYAHIDKSHRHRLRTKPLDIVFIANGEPNAEANWERLKEVIENRPNRVHRLDGVDGRVAAYQAAARLSETPWFFAVFAKLFVGGQFDWNWQPDRMQQPKHYIFHARNPVNDLEYGHQAMIAYNVRMTLANTGEGLDFTLDQPHEVVPILSGVANYHHSAWMAWRTAFRECIKLRHSFPDVENEYRLNRWLTQGHGTNGVFSVMGAQDAVEYYESVKGDFAELRKTYEWSWLSGYALMKRPQLFTQSNT